VIGYFDADGREIKRARRGTSVAPRNATTAKIGLRCSPWIPMMLSSPCVTIGPPATPFQRA
jgi:hypothetical protein